MKKYLSTIALVCLCLVSCGVGKQQNDVQDENIISGYVRDDAGKAVQNVVVSDGVSVTLSDANGYYQMPYDRASGRFVFISTPAGYRNSSFR